MGRAVGGFVPARFGGQQLKLIVTDGCAGLAAALQTVYPRVAHQRCWVHKMRNTLESVRRRDQEAVKEDAQAIYRADSLQQTRAAFRRFQWHWQQAYPAMVKRLEPVEKAADDQRH